MKMIVVENVLYAGTIGGAIFSGSCEDGGKHRLVARYDVMPRPPVVGETWNVEGAIQNHPIYGRQVVTTKAVLVRPSGRLIIKSLAKSSDFPGIGDKLAEHLWRRFGEDLYGMLETGNPEPFEGPLHSKLLAKVLINGWQDKGQLSVAYQWLDRHGVPVTVAEKVVALYQDGIVEKLAANPYRLLAITNWETADRVARSMGVELFDERRLIAAADTAVMKRLGRKHTWATEPEFRETIKKIIDCSGLVAARAVELAVQDHGLVRVGEGLQGLGPASMEEYIATMITDLNGGDFKPEQMTLRQAADASFITSFLKRRHSGSGVRLNQAQQDALLMALNEPVMILCGGAGVGKTTVLKAICEATEQLGSHVYMLALSGRAARRMSEATGREAMTIAAFINRVDRGDVVFDGEPTIAIDEASMLDLPTTYRLLRLLEPGCRLLLIGDPGQLPPISFGVVFHALVETSAVPMVELTEIHRQAAATGIPQASTLLRSGIVPETKKYAGREPGIYFVDCNRESILRELRYVIKELGGFDEAQILSPLKNGAAGTWEINWDFHRAHLGGVLSNYEGFAVGEPVIWMQNDYNLGLMNGSLGKVVDVEESLVVDWDGDEEKIIENPNHMDHAFAITIHKSQGSQFKRVIVPVFECRMLDRTLLYTAITRAQEQVVLIGDRQAFERAIIAPPSTSVRKTGMRFALAKAAARTFCHVS